MTNSLGYGMLNTGTFFGNGYTNVYSGGRTSSYGGASYNRVASSANINRIARDIAQGYSQDMEVIDLYLQQGDVNKALEQYESLFEDAKLTVDRYGYDLSDKEIQSIINQSFTNTTGTSFINAIKDGTKSPFVTGLLEGIPVVGLFVNGNSNAEAVSKLTGKPVSEKDILAEKVGSTVAGGVIAAVGTGMAIAGMAAAGPIVIGAGALVAIAGLIKSAVKGK